MAQEKQLLPRRDPADPIYIAIRNVLIGGRKAAGLSQASLAARVGRPQSFIAKVERGERYLDMVEFLVLANILKLDVPLIIEVIRKDYDGFR